HRIARERQGLLKVLAGSVVPPTAKLEFAKRRWVERIGREQVALFDRADFCQPTLRTLVLGDRNCAVERDYRRRTYRHQCVVAGNNGSPVSVLDAESARVNR